MKRRKIAGPGSRPAHEGGVHAAIAMQLERGAPLWLAAKGISMLTLFRPGNRVCVERLAPGQTVAIGSVVASPKGVKLITHRVVDRTPEGLFILKGDTLVFMDEPVREADLSGVVTAIGRGKRKYAVRVDVEGARLSVALGEFVSRFYPTKIPVLRECVWLGYIALTLLLWPFRTRLGAVPAGSPL